MIVAVASGKGGTGKTTVAASLAWAWDRPVTAVDLDVEEPNLHLFLKPEFSGRETAFMEVPVADESRCTHCRACADLCQFKAVSVLGTVLLTFPEMCHGCGGCIAVCPEKALAAGRRALGEIAWGRAAGRIGFWMGRLRVGEAMSPPLMRAVIAKLAAASREERPDVIPDVIIDAPPGVSCPAVNAVLPSDVILLVTEPTPFGFHDFKLAHEAFAPLGKPLAVVINRAGLGDRSVQDYCGRRRLPILAEIPFDRRLAEAYSRGRVLAEALPEMGALFARLAASLRGIATCSARTEAAAHA
jgi:MinD superfamily P-loop ATPase